MPDLSADESGEFNAWPAFVDLLAATVLLLLAVIAVVIVIVGRGEGVATWREELSRRLNEVRLQDSTAFSVDSSDAFSIEVVLPAGATFPRDRFEFELLTPRARLALERIAGVLRQDTIRELTREIRIVGHTDSVPFSDPRSSFSNWELSASRAAAVARYLVTVAEIDPCIVTATGRGSHYPAGDRESPRSPSLDRRIGIQILPDVRSVEARREAKTGYCDPVGDGTVAQRTGRSR